MCLLHSAAFIVFFTSELSNDELLIRVMMRNGFTPYCCNALSSRGFTVAEKTTISPRDKFSCVKCRSNISRDQICMLGIGKLIFSSAILQLFSVHMFILRYTHITSSMEIKHMYRSDILFIICRLSGRHLGSSAMRMVWVRIAYTQNA